MFKQRFNTKQFIILALLVALNIILSRFLSVAAWNLKIGFAFVPVVIAAILFGPIGGGIVAAFGDFIGALAFPIGAYFPGFTLTAFLTGAIYGIFLHKRQSLPLILAASVLTNVLCSLLLNTLWISILYGTSFTVLLPTRLLQACAMMVVETVIVRTLTLYTPVLRQSA